MFRTNRRCPPGDLLPETNRGWLPSLGTSKRNFARIRLGRPFARILLTSVLVGFPSTVSPQSPTGAKFTITSESGDRTRVVWRRPSLPIIHLLIDNRYLDKFRGSLGEVTQSSFIVLFAERNSLDPFFRDPADRNAKKQRETIRITLFADDNSDLHWSVWRAYSPNTIAGSHLIARRYNRNLLQLSIEQIRYKDLVHIPALGSNDKSQLLWDDFDVYIFDDARNRASSFKDAYFECVGSSAVRASPMHRCQLRAHYRDLTVRVDLPRRSLADTEPFEARLKQVLDGLFAP